MLIPAILAFLGVSVLSNEGSTASRITRSFEAATLAKNGEPDHVDPYELIIYQTGQMSKSLFMLSQEDFLKTIGKN